MLAFTGVWRKFPSWGHNSILRPTFGEEHVALNKSSFCRLVLQWHTIGSQLIWWKDWVHLLRIGSERDLWIFGRELIKFSRDTRTCTVLCISYFLFGIWHLWNGFFYISETAPAIPGVAQTHVQQTSQRLKVNDDNDNDGDDNDDDDCWWRFLMIYI